VAESCGLSQVVMFVNADIVGVGNVPVTQQTDSTFADSQDRELSNGSNLRCSSTLEIRLSFDIMGHWCMKIE
jgi:hypothetical protein